MALYVSPSQLQSFVSCERRWYYESVSGEPRPDDSGGQYLAFGQLVDYLADEWAGTGRNSFVLADVVAAVRERHAEVGVALAEEKWAELGERALRAFRTLQPFLERGTTQHRYRVPVQGVGGIWGRAEDAPIVLTGRCDIRAHGGGLLLDVKTTVDRKAGVGRDASTPAYAKTPTTLREDWQARCYAWAEFRADPTRLSVEVRWVYVSKTAAANAWPVSTTFTRAETFAWFESNVRPILERMLELEKEAPGGLAPELAEANHDGCKRCFMKHVCSPFEGRQKHQRGSNMVDLNRLRSRQAAGAPARSGAAAINRPVVEPTPGIAATSALPVPTYLAAAEPAREDTYAALVAEAAEVAGGTEGDRRADVVGHLVGVGVSPSVVEALVTEGDRRADVVFDGPDTVVLPPTDVPPVTPADAPPVTPGDDPGVRRGRGRLRKPRPGPNAGYREPESPEVQHIEALATAVQQFADAASSLVSSLNAELRRLGVGVKS